MSDYDAPFQREHGLAGAAFSPHQLVHEVYDNTNHETVVAVCAAFS